MEYAEFPKAFLSTVKTKYMAVCRHQNERQKRNLGAAN